jgi:glycosyltransferase involved in cell wall biosynthesis
MMGSSLRVLLVTDWMPEPGGAEANADVVRAGLTAAGDDVRLLTSSAGSAAYGTADFVAYGTQHRALQSVLQIANPFAVRQAREAVRRFQPDVALIHMFAYHLSPAVVWALGNLPSVLMVLDYKIVCPLGSKLLPTGDICRQRAGLICWQSGCLSLPHWLRDQARYACIKRVIDQPKLVLACSRHVQRELRANGIEAEHLGLPVTARGRAFTRRPSRHPHFVFCGRLSVEKGVTFLVRAFARLQSQIPAARLTIVGDGPTRGEIEAVAITCGLDGSVTFTGWLDPSGVERQLEKAWALIAPAIWAEPFGLVALEAIVRGVPVIASKTGGFSETVEDEVSGLLFPNGDESALINALERVATGEAFPTHSLDADIVARTTQCWSVENHIVRLRAHLQRIAGRLSGSAT